MAKLPTRDILNFEGYCNLNLCNLTAWVVSPNSSLKGEGLIKLSNNKSTKVSKIYHNVEALVLTLNSSLSQVLLYLNRYHKTGSISVVNDLVVILTMTLHTLKLSLHRICGRNVPKSTCHISLQASEKKYQPHMLLIILIEKIKTQEHLKPITQTHFWCNIQNTQTE